MQTEFAPLTPAELDLARRMLAKYPPEHDPKGDELREYIRKLINGELQA